jgi:hypothetical protein
MLSEKTAPSHSVMNTVFRAITIHHLPSAPPPPPQNASANVGNISYKNNVS